MKREFYSIAEPLTSEGYIQLLQNLVRFCDRGLFVLRSTDLNPAILRLIESLETYNLKNVKGSSWPGTELSGHEADIFTFDFNDESLLVLLKSAENLTDWLEPNWPEDLSFLRPDGTPFFVSITHENAFYFDIDVNEYDAVSSGLPNLKLRKNSN